MTVRPFATPKLLSEVDFGGAQSTIAANRDDLKKALLVLNTMGLILVPFQSVDPTSTTTTPAQSATQLIDDITNRDTPATAAELDF